MLNSMKPITNPKRVKKGEKIIYSGWICLNGDFQGDNLTQKQVDEHLKEHNKHKPSLKECKPKGWNCPKCGLIGHAADKKGNYKCEPRYKQCFIDKTCEIDIKASKKMGKYIHMKDHDCGVSPTVSGWEENLKLYLTSAGDRRRTIYFIKQLLSSQRQRIREKIKGMKLDVRPEITEWLWCKNRDEGEGYNKALDDILELV